MADYYLLIEDTDSKVIGPDYPQCIGLVKGYDNEYSNPHSLYYFAHQKGVEINYIPDLSSIKIGARTKLTDWVSCSLGPGNDHVVSLKIKNILGKYKTSEIQFFDCILNQKDKIFNYCWIHFVYNLEKWVDYKRSEFTHSNEKLLKKIAKIERYEDFLSFYDKEDTYGLIRSTRTVLKHPQLDYFVVGRYNQKHYISKALKDELFETGVSGVTFEEADDIIFV